MVCSRFCGLTSTFLPDEAHGSSSVRDVGLLHQKPCIELAQWAVSKHVLEASIGVAAHNTCLEVDESKAVFGDALELLLQKGEGKRIAILGHFPTG